MSYQLHDPFPGVKLWVDADTTDAGRLMSIGQYEWRKAGYMRQRLRPGMTFVDVGAHIGYFTMLAASIVGYNGQVTAWEPDSDNASWIWRSSEVNGYEDIVTTYHMLAGKGHGLRTFYHGPSSGQHSTLPLSPYSCEVYQSELDTSCEAADIVKIDVEAAELDVLQGATELLKNTRHILMDLHPELGADPAPVEALLHDAGFKLYDIRSDFVLLEHIPPTLVELLAVRT